MRRDQTAPDRRGSYTVPSRQMAYRIPASLRASARTATRLPRRFSTSSAQRCIGSFRRARRAAHAACTKHQRSAVGPAFVMLGPAFPLGAGVLARYEAQIRLDRVRAAESADLVERGDETDRRRRADAGHRHQPSRDRIRLGGRRQFPIRVGDLLVQRFERPSCRST